MGAARRLSCVRNLFCPCSTVQDVSVEVQTEHWSGQALAGHDSHVGTAESCMLLAAQPFVQLSTWTLRVITNVDVANYSSH